MSFGNIRGRWRCVVAVAAVQMLAGPILFAQDSVPQRPKITGISHAAYFVSDLPKAIAFWHDLLGFDEAYDLRKTGEMAMPGTATDVRIAFIKINNRQHVELFNEAPTAPHNMMSHICFSVDNIEQMRAYLKAEGFDVPAAITSKTRAGDYAFEIKDPNGMLVEFVQSLPGGMEAKAAGKYMPASRVSTHIYHVGFMVGNSAKSLDFYGRVLGFREIWRGTGDPKVLSWINMQVPDGTDYVEFMLYGAPLTVGQWGEKNHIALEVPDMAKAVAEIESRPAFKSYGKALSAHAGKNGKLQANLYDPDGTRVELMEPHTVDGKPVPSSTAPPPVPQN